VASNPFAGLTKDQIVGLLRAAGVVGAIAIMKKMRDRSRGLTDRELVHDYYRKYTATGNTAGVYEKEK
jgi:hypothetical protein